MDEINEIMVGSNEFILNIFSDIQNNINGIMEPIQSFALVLAGIGSIIYLAKQLLPMIERNEGIQIYPLLKPIFVALVVTNFGVVITLLDVSLSAISKALDVESQVTTVVDIDFKEAKSRNKDKLEAEFLQLKKESSSKNPLQKLWEKTKQAPAELFYWATGIHLNQIGDQIGLFLKYDVLYPALAWLATTLGALFYVIMNMMSRFYIIFLCLFGPLSFALSQFTPFQSSFGSWLARYISVGLWPAMANLLKYMSNQVLLHMNGLVGDSFEGGITLFLILLMLTYFYLQIPEISEYVVTSGGVAGLNKSMTNKIKQSTKVAVGVPAVAVGGAMAGGLMAVNDGVISNQMVSALHKTLSAPGQKTGALGKISRGSQQVGNMVGTFGQTIYDRSVSSVKGESSLEREARIAQRISSRQEKQSLLNAPKKKEMRQKAKNVSRLKRQGHRLTGDQEELLSRYQSGWYKGRGKYIPSPEQKRTETLKEMKNFVLQGFSYGSSRPKPGYGDWKPPFKFPKA